MIDLDKKLTIDKDYKIRKENFGAILFHRPSLGISKTSSFVFEIYKEIDTNHYSVNELVKYFNISDEDKNTFIKFLNNLLEDGGIQYGDKRLVQFQQVFDYCDSKRLFQAPNMVWWDITSACNLNCYYCYSASGCKSNDELTYDETLKIIDQLSEMGVFYIYFLGGEPFMKNRFLDIIDYVYDVAGMGVMVTTNGTLINNDMSETLKKISNIRISLDSANKVIHNKMRRKDFSYDKCINSLEILSKLNMGSLGINSTIGPDNYQNLIDLYKLANKYKCNIIQMIPVCGSGRAVDEGRFLSSNQRKSVLNQLKEIEKIINSEDLTTRLDAPEGYIDKRFNKLVYDDGVSPDIMGCSAGKTCLAIQQNGKVGYCLMCRDPIGDLRVEDFKTIFYNLNLKTNKNKMKFCKNCKHNNKCFGPCMVNESTCKCNKERERVVASCLKIF